MTTPSGSRPPGDGAWASRLTARPAAQPASRRAARRTSARRAPLAQDRLRLLHERLAARFAVPPRAVLGLVLLSVVVLAVLGVRLVLAGAEVGAAPMVPAAAAPSAAARPGSAATANGSGAPGLQGASSPAAAASGSPSVHAGAPARATSPQQGGAGVVAPSAAGGVGPNGAPGVGTVSSLVVVHVVGRVRHPGVVRLPEGARVEQAVAAAGGARRDADLTRVNLARPLVDGEQVVVPRPGDPVEAAMGSAPAAGGGPPRGTSPAEGGLRPAQLVDLNTATLAELDTLPGVGPVLAQRILDWRAENGRFTAVDELGEVSGIGDAVLARVRPLVRL